MHTTHFTSAVRAALAATTAALVVSPAAHAAAKKPAAPPLTIESKACNIGPDADDRTAVVTALASYDGTGDKVQLRFGLQQRIDTKSRWRAVTGTANGDLSTWATTDASATDLRYTKTITGLAEGMQYRVAIDARSVTVAGKAASAQRRRYVTCKQPQFTPKLTFQSTTVTNGADGPVLDYAIRNAGRLASGPVIISLYDGDTRSFLSTIKIDGIAGGKLVKGFTTGPTCPSSIFMTVTDSSAEDQTTPADSALVKCADATASRAAVKRR